MAVVVQKMVESEVSGIAFSVHPVTEDQDQLIIEAGFGLGEAIVSGQITPDSYVVGKQPRRILDKNISEQERGLFRSSSFSSPQLRGGAESSRQRGGVIEPNEWKTIPQGKRNMQKLSDAQILELSHWILKIEDYFGFPCDIEWALASGEFYILQSRPITTLSRKTSSAKSETALDYKKIDWAHYLSRPKEFFLTNILVKDFKGAKLTEALGFGHDYWLFLYNGGKTMDLYRRVDELQTSDAFMRVFIQDEVKIKKIFAEARKIIARTEKLIANYKAKKQKVLCRRSTKRRYNR